MGASCHMCTTLKGMFDTRNGSGGIKVGSGKVFKILIIGQMKLEVQQKDGLIQVVVLKDVHFVLDLYCNFCSITKALDDGFTLSGGRKEFYRNMKVGGEICLECNLYRRTRAQRR